MGTVVTSGFQPRTLDKVERLLDLLDEIQRHPDLKGKLAMHGGTAINLFMLGVPRLSVDIDISYIGALSRDEMQLERPLIERAIEEVGRSQGYSVSGAAGGHAGRTFVLQYRGSWGADHVKIDCIYMNRSPLLPVRPRVSPLRPSADVLMFDDVELAGGKVKAFFDRVKIRDLYDISNLKTHFDCQGDPDGIFHKVALYYASLSACFPNDFERRSERFASCQKDLESQLIPMLHNRDTAPQLACLMEDAEAFVSSYVSPRNERERLYLKLFASGEYRPELVFDDAEMARSAEASPEAMWKLANLRKMLRCAERHVGSDGRIAAARAKADSVNSQRRQLEQFSKGHSGAEL